MVAGAGILPAQAIAPRWELQITSATGVEEGDLRLDGTASRMLLSRDDSTFQPLTSLHVDGGHISFVLPRSGRTFDGSITGARMQGTVRSARGDAASWEATPLALSSSRWPVPPRVTVRQLLLGSTATSVTVPGAWRAILGDSMSSELAYRAVAGTSRVAAGARRDGAAKLVSGLDTRGRHAAAAAMTAIASAAADDPTFRAQFARGRALAIDMHDIMPAEAAHYQYGYTVNAAIDGFIALGALAPGSDTNAFHGSALQLLADYVRDSAAVLGRINALDAHDGAAAGAVRATLAGYSDAIDWWKRALRWLLTHRWLRTGQGLRSPAELMALFWGVDSLPLPEIVALRTGSGTAFPVAAFDRIAAALIAPKNGSARDWLARGGVADVFAAWRTLRWGESPALDLSIGAQDRIVTSPSAQAQVHPGSMFGERDAIHIDAGIVPVAAVATFLHEWNHLLATERRLAGVHPPALDRIGGSLVIREDDPWLREGFAEWATEQVLKPAGESARYLQLTQVEKRLGIAEGDAEEPHWLGYRLFTAAAPRSASAATFRNVVVANLDDLPRTAHLLGLAGPSRVPPLTVQRPATAVVVPEVSFTWNDGTVFDLSRRLVIPNTRSEH